MNSIATERILVALDPSLGGRATLDAAVGLAALLEAEVLGLFVEDVDLVRLSELPCAEEVMHRTGSARRLDRSSLERALRTQRVDLERTLSVAAEGLRVRWSVRVTRGRILDELHDAARDVDVVVLGGATKLRSGLERRHLALFDGSDAAYRALEIASRAVSHGEGETLFIAITRLGPDERSNAREQLDRWLREHHLRASLIFLPRDDDLAGLGRLLSKLAVGTLLLPLSHPLSHPEASRELMRRSGCLTLLVP